jgi:AcrR family transcriptional regulator
MSGASPTRQVLQTRGALLRSGRRVFEQRGYHRTRITDIASGAGLSVGAFYKHFTSKNELFRSLLVSVEDEVYGELAAHRETAGAPRERIRQTNELYMRAFQRNARFWAAIEEAGLTDPESRGVLAERRGYYQARTRRAIHRWQSQGVVSPRVNTDDTAALLGAMTERSAYLVHVFGEPVDPHKLTDTLTGLWLRALGL